MQLCGFIADIFQNLQINDHQLCLFISLFFIHLHFNVCPNYFGDFLPLGQFRQTINIG